MVWFASRPVVFWCCVTVVGVTAGLSGNHRVSGSLVGAMRVLVQVLGVLLYSTYSVFHVACLFQGFPPLPFSFFLFFIVLFIIYSVGSPITYFILRH